MSLIFPISLSLSSSLYLSFSFSLINYFRSLTLLTSLCLLNKLSDLLNVALSEMFYLLPFKSPVATSFIYFQFFPRFLSLLFSIFVNFYQSLHFLCQYFNPFVLFSKQFSPPLNVNVGLCFILQIQSSLVDPPTRLTSLTDDPSSIRFRHNLDSPL